MPSEPPNDPEESGLIIPPSTGLIRLPDGGSPALSEIVNRSLVHIQTSKTLSRLHRIGEHELRWPDYQLVCFWAEQLNMPHAAILMILLKYNNSWAKEYQTTIEDHQFVNLLVAERLEGITCLPPIDGLRVKKLAVIRLSLSFFDLSPVPNLSSLWCDENQLTQLDLSPVPNLTWLSCNGNQLASFDLSPVPNLESLLCDHNKLTELDLTPVSNLTELACNGNQLTQLDLSPVPNLTWLSCRRNQLTSLDLSPVPNLSSLWCDENQLTQLDLSPVPNLESLRCDHNKLTELDLSLVPNHFSLDCDSIRLIQRPDQNF